MPRSKSRVQIPSPAPNTRGNLCLWPVKQYVEHESSRSPHDQPCASELLRVLSTLGAGPARESVREQNNPGNIAAALCVSSISANLFPAGGAGLMKTLKASLLASAIGIGASLLGLTHKLWPLHPQWAAFFLTIGATAVLMYVLAEPQQ